MERKRESDALFDASPLLLYALLLLLPLLPLLPLLQATTLRSPFSRMLLKK